MSFLQQSIDAITEMQERMEKKSFFFMWRIFTCVSIVATLPFICTYFMHAEGMYRNAWLISVIVIAFSIIGYFGSTVILWREGPTNRDVDNLIRKTQSQLYSADKWIEECEKSVKRVDELANTRSEQFLKLQGDLAASEIVIAAQKEEITKLRADMIVFTANTTTVHFSKGN